MKTAFFGLALIIYTVIAPFFLTKPIHATHNGDYNGKYEECTFSPAVISNSNPTPVIINVKTGPGFSVNANVKIKNLASSEEKEFVFDEEPELRERNITIPVDKYSGPGEYKVSIEQRGNDSSQRNWCIVERAFKIANSNSNIKFTAPSAQIEVTKTLPLIQIEGLPPNANYLIKIGDSWGDNHDLLFRTGENDEGENLWGSGSKGIITAKNICENGEANRPENGQNPCSENFNANEIYYMAVFKAQDGQNTEGGLLAEHSFKVGYFKPGAAGKNPCVDGKCNTALGLISSDPTEFVGSILSIALGLAGGIALIIMVIGSVGILTSSGDQNKLNANRDKIIAAIAGLLFLIFSVLILRFLGIVFKIPFT